MTAQNKAFIIAEVAQAHDGNLNIAHAFVDAVAKTGADAIKFQTHYADQETSTSEPWRKKFSRIDETRYDYWKRMEFTPDEWAGLADHSRQVGLEFMSSPFSLKANDVLAQCGMSYWKIASGELTNYPLIDDICRRGGSIILSCGLSEEDEIARTVMRIRDRGATIMSVLECTSNYPTSLEEIDLQRMSLRGTLLDVKYGLSDHSADPLPSICAMTLGANVIEVHATMHEDYFGPDNPASLTLRQIKELVSVRDRMARLMAPGSVDNINRDRMKKIFRKSIYLAKNVVRGQLLTLNDLAFKKPLAGIGAECYEDVIGRVCVRNISRRPAIMARFKMTILCFITARPSYSRVKTVLQGFEDIGLDYGVVCLASATETLYGNVADLVAADGYRVVRRLSTQLASSTGVTAAKTTALGLLSISEVIETHKPRAVISIADRYETIATAIAASYQNTPCIHIQGGELTGNIDDKVRDAVSSLSDVHFPSTQKAATRLKAFVKNPDAVFAYGCPSVDLYLSATQMSREETVSRMLQKSVGYEMSVDDPYTVVMMHPDTNDIEGSEEFVRSLLNSSSAMSGHLIWFWPNADPGSDVLSKVIRQHREANPDSRLRLVKNLEPNHFVNLLRHSRGLIGNSSVGVREAGILGLPTLDIGGRQANREKHENVINLPYNVSAESILSALTQTRRKPSFVYGKGDAGLRIAERIASLFPTEAKSWQEASGLNND